MTVADTEEVTPALFDHAKTVYEEMLKRSHKELPPGQELEPVDEIDVYEGHLTRLFADLSIANPYYTKIKNALVGQNCIEQLRRGGGVGLSKWILHNPPTEEGFKAIAERRRSTSGKSAIQEQRIKDLTLLTNNLCEQVDTLQTNFTALARKFDEVWDDLQTMKRAQ